MKALLLATIPLLIAGAFAYYLSRRSPDLRYQLSSSIPLADSRSVQQLEVLNNGNAPAPGIRVRTHKPIREVSVVKNSLADTYQRFDTSDGTEIVYGTPLPPLGTVKFVFTLGDAVLRDQDVDVNHAEGKGKPALTESTNLGSLLGSGLFCLGAIFYGWLSFREVTISLVHSETVFRPLKVLRRKKPLILSVEKWKELRAEAMGRIHIELPYDTKLTSWDAVRMLSSDKPEYFSDDEWHGIIDVCTTALTKVFGDRASSAHVYGNTKRLVELLTLPQPRHVNEEKWQELQAKIKKEYINTSIDSSLKWGLTEPDAFLDKLRVNKPEFFSDDEWNGYRKRFQILYFASLLNWFGTTPLNSLNLDDANISVLTEHNTKTLKELLTSMRMVRLPDLTTLVGAERFLREDAPKWMSADVYEDFRDRAKRTIKVAEDSRRNEFLERAFRDMLSGCPLGEERPKFAGEDEWANLKKIDLEVRKAAEDNQQKADALAGEEQQVEKLKRKVLRQLEVIKIFLDDPAVLDRLEEYEEVFAPGNFNNLKRLASNKEEMTRREKAK